MAWISDLSQAIHNESGQVALCYVNTTNPLISLPSGKSYKFDTHWNVCLAWVDPEDAPKLLEIKGGCCGGKKSVIRVANEANVRMWTNGSR